MRQIAFVIRDVITHTILSVKGQLNGNSQETANFVLFFFSHIHFVDNITAQKVDGNEATVFT